MRITFNMQSMKYDSSISGALEAMTAAADRVNKKQNLLAPEQNSSNYVGAYNIQRMIDEITQFSKNADTANGWLSNASKQLESALKELQKAKNEFAIGGLDAANDADSRLAMADQVKKIYETLMSSANASYLDRYIFGGYLTSTPPFTQNGNSVSSVISSTQNGGNATASSIFSDLKELGSGKYKATITIENGVGKLTLQDSNGKTVMIDNNGSDQAGSKGNNSSGELLFEYKPGMVINTGRGLSFKMPDSNVPSVVLEFNYQSGSEMAYNGDANSIFAKIGYNQDIALNMPGSSIFAQDYKTLLGTTFNTMNGRPVSLGTLFSNLDRTNISLGDSITIKGTDHSGKPIGSASIISAINPKLDQTNTSVEERTLRLTQGNKVYQIVVPSASYKTTEELSDAINNQLQFAEFLGTIEMPANGFQSLTTYQSNIHNLMSSEYFTPATNDADSKKLQVDLRKDISISNDGDRLTFTTSAVGNNVMLAVSGGKSSSLGFQNITLASQGKDNVFELGFDFSPNGIEDISNRHTGVDFTGGRANRDYLFVVNGERIRINVPAPTYATPTTTTGVDLSGATDYSFTINGKTIVVPRNQLAVATTNNDKIDLINKYINDAGFGGEFNVDITGAPATANITLFQQTSPTKKDIEFQLNEELRKAGISDVTASLSTISGSGNGALGNFNVSFQSTNNNIGKSTQITSVYVDETAVPATHDFQTDRQSRTGQGVGASKTIGDYVNFLQTLYGEGVNVSLVDGKIQLKDNVSGSSRLNMIQQSSNTGVGIAGDYATVLGGRFTGASDTTWNFTVNTEMQPNGSRTVAITIRDVANNVVFDKRFPNYLGGNIELPLGVTINPNDMNVPTSGNSNTTVFSTKFTANSNLSMGDMKVTSDGTSVNIFRELKNLEHALRYNITSNGFGTPSSWKNNTLTNSAKPFFDGTYRGNYNDNWKYEVLQNGSKTNYYLQNEYKNTTGDIKFDQNLINANGNMLFNIDVFDNKTGQTQSVPININLQNAHPPLTDAKSTQNYILKELNNNATMKREGISFSTKNGKIEMSSNSGSKIASISEKIDNTVGGARQTEFTRYILGLDTVANSKITFPMTLNAPYNFQVIDLFEPNAGVGVTKNISVPMATYNSPGDLIAALNTELATVGVNGSGGRITASMGADGSIIFKNADGSLARSAFNGLPADNQLGINGTTAPSSMGPKGLQIPKLDLTTVDDSARTLKFNYLDKDGKQASTSIILDKKAYGSTQEMADEINRLITAGGVINGQVTAKVSTDGMLTFQTSDAIAAGDTAPIVRGLSVEGDYNGTLGFPKTGDEITLRVTSQDGTSIQEVKMSSANKTTYIADGLYLGFDKGTLNIADFFTGAVGSGIEKTISSLEQSEKQILTASSQFGNRESRVETVITFNKTIIESNENTKASYLGSTASDIAKAVTDLQLATAAYEAALTATNKLLSVSLLNFLK